MRVVHKGTPAYRRIIRELKRSRPALFVGSAVSIFEPTALQGGLSTTLAIASKLCQAAGVDEDIFLPLATNSAFEAILDQYPDQGALSGIFQDYFSQPDGVNPSIPNALHEAIAKLLERGTISNVITTNYDDCIERAFRGRLTQIVTKQSRVGGKNIFKLHGSVGNRKTLICSMKQERTMPAWKREIVRKLAGRQLLVIGYSGIDFEVCPELYDLPLDRLIWVARPTGTAQRPELKPNARTLLTRHDSVVISNDMRAVLRDLSGLSFKDTDFTKVTDLSDRIFSHLSVSDQRLWAGHVFNMLGAPSAVLAAVELERQARLPQVLNHRFRTLEAGGLSHAGRYVDAADIAKSLQKNRALSPLERVTQAIGESGAASMSGDDARAHGALKKAIRLADRLLSGAVRTKKILGIRWMQLLLARDSSVKTPAWIRSHTAKLRKLYLDALAAGDYGLAGLCSNEIKEISGERALAAAKGKMERNAASVFRQIGNYVGQVTALRDSVRRSMSSRLAKKLQGTTQFLSVYGLKPELWRVNYTLIHFEPRLAKRRRLYSSFTKTLKECQFHPTYVAQMMRAGKEAVAKPKGLRKRS